MSGGGGAADGGMTVDGTQHARLKDSPLTPVI